MPSTWCALNHSKYKICGRRPTRRKQWKECLMMARFHTIGVCSLQRCHLCYLHRSRAWYFYRKNFISNSTIVSAGAQSPKIQQYDRCHMTLRCFQKTTSHDLPPPNRREIVALARRNNCPIFQSHVSIGNRSVFDLQWSEWRGCMAVAEDGKVYHWTRDGFLSSQTGILFKILHLSLSPEESSTGIGGIGENGRTRVLQIMSMPPIVHLVAGPTYGAVIITAGQFYVFFTTRLSCNNQNECIEPTLAELYIPTSDIDNDNDNDIKPTYTVYPPYTP